MGSAGVGRPEDGDEVLLADALQQLGVEPVGLAGVDAERPLDRRRQLVAHPRQNLRQKKMSSSFSLCFKENSVTLPKKGDSWKIGFN